MGFGLYPKQYNLVNKTRYLNTVGYYDNGHPILTEDYPFLMCGGNCDVQCGAAGWREVDILQGLSHPLAQLLLVLLSNGQREEGLSHVVVGACAVILHLYAYHAHPGGRDAVFHLGA